MPDITQSELVDIATATLSKFKKRKLTDLASKFQKYHFFPQIFKKESLSESSGKNIEFYALTTKTGTARNVGYFAKKQIQRKDVLAKATLEWARTVEGFSLDKLEIKQNSGSQSQLISLFGAQRTAAFLSLIELVEDQGWSKPPTSSDTTIPHGIKSYFVKKVTGASATVGEFGGLNPTGFSSGVGFDSTVHSKWANWTNIYTAISPDDAVFKARRALDRTDWDTPLGPYMNEHKFGMPRKALYMNPNLKFEFEALAQKQNDQNQGDLFRFGGKTFIMGHPLIGVDALTADADDPIYGIDWSKMKYEIFSGYGPAESEPTVVDGYIGVISVDIELVGNLFCIDRKAGFVLAKSTNND